MRRCRARDRAEAARPQDDVAGVDDARRDGAESQAERVAGDAAGAGAGRGMCLMPSGSSRACRGGRGGCATRAGSLRSIAGEQPEPVPRSRDERLVIAAERLEAELDAERAGQRGL